MWAYHYLHGGHYGHIAHIRVLHQVTIPSRYPSYPLRQYLLPEVHNDVLVYIPLWP